MGWGAVTREDVLSFADSEGAASTLPKLIRRLVLETGRRVASIDVPGGTGISAGGFDGFVVAAEATPFVPSGRSVWELSVDAGSVHPDLVSRNDRQAGVGSAVWPASVGPMVPSDPAGADPSSRSCSQDGSGRIAPSAEPGRYFDRIGSTRHR